MKLCICSNAHQEIAMQFHTIRLILARLIPHSAQSPSQASRTSSAEADRQNSSALEFDPVWHGDHWQNLLSSPMDARRYVMEDWSSSTATERWNTDYAAPAH
jgi:hypothetical protein